MKRIYEKGRYSQKLEERQANKAEVMAYRERVPYSKQTLVKRSLAGIQKIGSGELIEKSEAKPEEKKTGFIKYLVKKAIGSD